jgi:hypothetical protein
LTAANAADADGDDLSVVANSVTLANGDPLPDYITYADGVLSIDKNHESLDNLYLGSEWTVAITYKITDGEATIDNTVNLTITGTADQFTGSTDKYAEHVTADFNTSTWDGSFNFTLTAPVGAFDFAGTALVTVTGDIDSSIHNEFVVVTLEGGDAVTLGLISATGKNQDETYSTDTATANFASADSTVTVTYDSNTAGGVNGVDGLSLVGVDVTADYTYWM